MTWLLLTALLASSCAESLQSVAASTPCPVIETLDEHDAGTRCAFQRLVGEAARRAADQLVANEQYGFTGLQGGWFVTESGHWEPVVSFGRAHQPTALPSLAIESLYRVRSAGECGTGRQVAQLAALYELFGAEALDESFRAEEMVIGTFRQLRTSQSVLLGSGAGELIYDGLARRAAEGGPWALEGLPGALFNVKGHAFLDSIANQAQNFVVYGVRPEAMLRLRAEGGVASLNGRLQQIWGLARGLKATWRRGFERALYWRESEEIQGLRDQDEAATLGLLALLDDPLLQGIYVYVHDHGVQPLAYHVIRMLDQNPRTPYRLELFAHNVTTEWLKRYLRACQRNLTAVP